MGAKHGGHSRVGSDLRPRITRGLWPPRQVPSRTHFAHKAVITQAALHIKHYMIRTRCIYSVLFSALPPEPILRSARRDLATSFAAREHIIHIVRIPRSRRARPAWLGSQLMPHLGFSGNNQYLGIPSLTGHESVCKRV